MSRAILDLHPIVREKASRLIETFPKRFVITSTYRSVEEQNELYAQGRTKPGKKVTNARGGYSYHNYGLAFDIVPMLYGKAIWDKKDPVWFEIAEAAESYGLEWAGRWKKFQEFPHFQDTLGYTIKELLTITKPYSLLKAKY